MTLPYSNTTSGDKAIAEIQKIVKAFGCNKFATGEDFETGGVWIQCEHQGRMIQLDASAKGYAAAWLKENPYNNRRKATRQKHESNALEKGSFAVYSILRDWVKGQLTAVECGVMTFDAAFLSHFMLPDGSRVIDKVNEQKMLPAPKEAA